MRTPLSSINKLLCVLFYLLVFPITKAQETTPQITFVCEHGVAKSVIAAAYFNQLAQQQGLAIKAIARGVNIEAQLQPATKSGLEKDGLDVTMFVPTPFAKQDADSSLRIITIGLEQQPTFLSDDKRLQWDDVPPVSKNYDAARDVLLTHIEQLLGELKAQSVRAR